MNSRPGNFAVDGIVKAVKELQQEKNQLEQRLNELRNKRRLMENGRDVCKGKDNQAFETNSKILDVHKMAQHKVVQTQNQTDSLMKNVHSREEELAEMNRKIENESSLKAEEKEIFHKNLQQLTKHLLHAKDYYSDRNLQDTVDKLHGEAQTIENEESGMDEKIEAVCTGIKEITVDAKSIEDKALNVNAKTQHDILELLAEEYQEMLNRKNKLDTVCKKMSNVVDVLSKTFAPSIGDGERVDCEDNTTITK